MGWKICRLYSGEGKILLSPPNSAQSIRSPPSYLFNMYRHSFLGVKRPEREVESSVPSSAKINNMFSSTSAPFTCLHWLWIRKIYLVFFIINFVEKLRLPRHMFYVLYHLVSSGKFSFWFMFKKLRQIYYPLSSFTVLRNPEYLIINSPPHPPWKTLKFHLRIFMNVSVFVLRLAILSEKWFYTLFNWNEGTGF